MPAVRPERAQAIPGQTGCDQTDPDYSRSVALPDGTSYGLFPTPETILGLDDVQFTELGLAF
jgi:hypothetical protein